MLDDDLQLKTYLEEHRQTFNESKESQSSYSYLYWLPDIIKDFILPAGFPGDCLDHLYLVFCLYKSYFPYFADARDKQ